MSDSGKKPVLAVLGPTASGKTSLALALAQHFNCEIVNCDSRQIYREMSIGTARPTNDEMKLVAHHLFDLIPPDKSFSAADYAEAATRTIKEIWQNGRVPLLTGGTGFYYSVVAQGLGEAGHDAAAAEELQQQLQQYGLPHMIKMLAELDSEAPGSIDTNNPRRVLRAIEIIRSSNRPLAANKPVSPLPEAEFLPLVVTRPREELHKNIEKRVDNMLSAGLETEVRQLVKKYGREADGLRSIGYQEWFAFFDQILDARQVRDLIIIHTRQYAKRQETWFRKRPGVAPVDISGRQNVVEIFKVISAFIDKFAL